MIVLNSEIVWTLRLFWTFEILFLSSLLPSWFVLNQLLKKIGLKYEICPKWSYFLQSGFRFVMMIRQKVDVMCQSHNPGLGQLPTVQAWESEDVIAVDQSSQKIWERDLRGEKNGQGYKMHWSWTLLHHNLTWVATTLKDCASNLTPPLRILSVLHRFSLSAIISTVRCS